MWLAFAVLRIQTHLKTRLQECVIDRVGSSIRGYPFFVEIYVSTVHSPVGQRSGLGVRIKALLAACKPLILLDFHRSFNDTPTMSEQASYRLLRQVASFIRFAPAPAAPRESPSFPFLFQMIPLCLRRSFFNAPAARR